MRIAALDDDELQLELIEQAMQAVGHVCHAFSSGADLQRGLRRESFDLLIVDWQLPDASGPEVVRWVRENVSQQMPIVFVTHRSEERDIMEGLGCGADDFMVKPVRIGELHARVAALLRRAYPSTLGGALEFGRYRFLPERASVEWDGKPVELKGREYDLALLMFQNVGRLLSRDHLKESVWGQSALVQSRSLDTHVSRLRTVLDLRPGNGYVITSVYGVGYRLEKVEPQPQDLGVGA